MLSLAHRSPREKTWLVGGLLGAVLLVLLGWTLFIGPQRSDTDTVHAQLLDVQQESTALQTRITALRAESKDMSKVRAALHAAQAALPTTSGVPELLRSLQALGSRTGADVVSLSVGSPVAVTSGTLGTLGTTSGAEVASSEGGTTTLPATAPLYSLAISAQVNGTPDQLLHFLDSLQTGQPRAVLVTQLTQGSTEDGATSLQLTMSAFAATDRTDR